MQGWRGSIAGLIIVVLAPQWPEMARSADRGALASVQASGTPATAEALREIDDPHSGARWLLMRDEAHPGGPGRLVLLQPHFSIERVGAVQPRSPIPLPVIRAGDRVQVEEHTQVVDAVLDAIALGTAVAGAPLRLRLKLGGRVVRALAVSRGRAALIHEAEARP
jgi:hypothetical protein